MFGLWRWDKVEMCEIEKGKLGRKITGGVENWIGVHVA
jgi:hypothetical protein